MESASSGQTALSGHGRVCSSSPPRSPWVNAVCVLCKQCHKMHPGSERGHVNHLSNPNTKCDENDNQTLSVVMRVYLCRVWDGCVRRVLQRIPGLWTLLCGWTL